MFEHGVRQLAHTVLQQTLACCLLELADLLSNVPLDERSIPSKRLLQGSRRDVLGHTVYPLCVLSLPGGPDGGESFVGLLTHQERIWHEQKLFEVFSNIRAVE